MNRFDLARGIRYLVTRQPFLYRLRYALITELGGVDFSGSPEPAGDAASGIPREYLATVARLELAGDGDFDDARTIAFDLSRGHRRGPGIGRASVEALERIYSGRAHGVCSDYTQVFLGLCRAAGVAAREWGLCSRFDQHGIGHAVAEIYSPSRGRWIFLDPLFSIYAVGTDDVPLAVVDMIDLATAGRAERIAIRLIDPEGKPGAKRDAYVARYFDPGHAFFLLSRNEVFAQDPFLAWVRAVPPPVVHLAMILAGRYQRFQVYTNAHNQGAMAERMAALRAWFRRILILLAIFFILGTIVGVSIWTPTP